MQQVTVENRARYIPENTENDVLGKLRATVCCWTVNGLHHLHEFRFVQYAETLHRFIKLENRVEHWLNGKMLADFAWGHGTVQAYASSQTWRESARKSDFEVCLISTHVFRHDLPCCGGEFVLEKEIVDYTTLQRGHCSKCCQKWDITDGHHFSKGITLQEIEGN